MLTMMEALSSKHAPDRRKMRQLFATPPACLFSTWLKKVFHGYFSVLGSVEKIFEVHISKHHQFQKWKEYGKGTVAQALVCKGFEPSVWK